MKFNGDVIITDPCYIMRSENDWADCDYGENLTEIGIKTFITSDGGDSAGQTIRDSLSGEILGRFCTDSGMVSAILLKELVAYNSCYRNHLSQSCYSIIKDFIGDIEKVDIENDDNQHWTFIANGNKPFRIDGSD